ncbi:trehalose-6-phosphate synthase [Pseudoclavibacter sp. CFCC 14310]|uniref:alpha,alpha-trehalose-phosphate synthase (UDP-forming) n=1 Tax=Pseudoclavibacter sp. CFCC 14310 TaxID=2615180 RepID=UPI001300F9EE|nr:trehalose-6-phosphate synthase [Pseudoclavibacter sp. CFCC 14310]KAB1647574.1 trehalose-6-phosphate synthase [Pseudoclavibacter sp. CFCC 14310]
MSTPAEKFDLIVVSNRLPVDRTVDSDGNPGWRRSPGGLVTALEPVMELSNGAWVGWPGVPDEEFEPFVAEGGSRGGSFHVYPVSLSETELESYYEGFSNATLWPLYHDVIAPPLYHRVWWDSYKSVNERFAARVADIASSGATVWVQDYQLQLVPRILRRIRPDLSIGFFNHIPFPSYGLFAQLPWRRQILEGLLGADLIGFQRSEDARNFARAVRTLLGITVRRGQIDVPAELDGGSGHVAAFHDYPISIDADEFEQLGEDPEVQERARQIRRDLGDPHRVLLGIDRLDYTKGIRHRLKAYGELLDEGRVDVEDTTLIQIAVPSRERVETYKRLRDDIELSVARINGDHSTIGRPAIQYLHRSFPRREMAAFYLAADILLVTALRDGMNLVAKEFVATHVDNDAVLVLSEFAGASDELKTALLINPHDIDGLKQAIVDAMQMPEAEVARRMRIMRRHVREDNVERWSDAFLARLREVSAENRAQSEEAPEDATPETRA